jgi:hypothetical protein
VAVKWEGFSFAEFSPVGHHGLGEGFEPVQLSADWNNILA